MKKLLLMMLINLLSYAAMANATVTQFDWRWRNDDGNETSATWKAAKNEQANLCANENLRLRIAFEINPDPNTTNTANKTTDYKLSYSLSSSGPWTKIDPSVSGQAFKLTSNSMVTNGTATTNQLASPSGFKAGQIITDAQNGTNLTFSTPGGVTSVTEHEWVLMPTASAQVNKVYYFKFEGADNFATSLPSIKVGKNTSHAINLVSCGDYTLNGTTYTSSGTYTQHLTNSYGCDSTILLNLTINTPAADKTLTGPATSICANTSSSIELANSETGVNYVLRNDADNSVISTSIAGTGSAITFNTGNLSDTTSFNVLASKSTSLTDYAMQFNGVDEYIKVPDNSVLNFNQANFTIEAYVKFSASQPDFTGLVVKAGTSGSWVGYQLLLFQNKIAAEIGTNLGGLGIGDGLVGTTALNDGEWHHVAMSVNRQTNDILLFVDGNMEASVNNGIVTGLSPNTDDLLIGTERTNSIYFNGEMDDIRIWNVAKSPNEINDLSFACFSGNPSDLVAYYPFLDEPTHTKAIDFTTGNPYTGTLVNMDGSNQVTSTTGIDCPVTCTTEMSQIVTVNVYALPTVTAHATNTAICDGASVKLYGSGADTYSWDKSVTDNTLFTPVSTETYTVTGTDTNGCTDTDQITVSVTTVDATTSLNGNVITATNASGTYQWIDCNDSNNDINGETSQSFTALTSGDFAVKVTESGCTVTSSCVNILVTGTLDPNATESVTLYPNPNNGEFVIETSNTVNVEVINSIGEMVMSGKLDAGKNKIQLDNNTSGVYYIITEDQSGKRSYRKMVIK